ncbi:hypothetical protein [Jannaschia sp. 2305UL9-9]|uniref:hypothetical protein n=1 Tax=Jannaschia sp. 2305UL9-9 TaxID=3121638 RepID=UPI00352849DD
MKHVDLTAPRANTILPPAFAHGNEHPQLDLPFTALVDGRELKGRTLSITRAIVSGTLPDRAENGATDAVLRMNFDGFSIVLFIDVWVERTVGGDAGDYVLHFTDPTASHLAPLRYLLNSHIAGDIVSLNGVMGYTGPVSVKAKAEVQAPSRLYRIRNMARRAVVVTLTAGLALMALNLAHERVVFAYESRPVTVTSPGQTLLATAAGQLSYVDEEAELGDVVYSLVSNSGDYISVKMPCDCTLEPLRDFVEGATILPGTPLVRLVSGRAGLVGNTDISADGAVRLVGGDAVELVMTNGRIVPVTPHILPSREDANRTVPIEITLDDVTGVSAGDVARLRFRRHLLPAFLRRSAPTD